MRAGALAILAGIVFATVLAAVDSGPAWPLVPLVTVLVLGIVGGIAGRTPFEALAPAVGLAVGSYLVTAVTAIGGGIPPSETVFESLLPAVPFAVMTGLVALFIHLAMPRVEQPVFRVVAGILLGCVVALAWYALGADTAKAEIAGYRLDGDRTLSIEALGLPHGWTRLAAVEETDASVRIVIDSTQWMGGSGAAYLERVPMTVVLSRPLGSRTVVDGRGNTVPEAR